MLKLILSEILKETEKAIFGNFIPRDEQGRFMGVQTWAPKSLLSEAQEGGEITAVWFIEKNVSMLVRIDDRNHDIEAKMVFSKYLNTDIQIEDIPGVTQVWPEALDNTLWNIVFVYEKIGFDITLKRIDRRTLKIVDFREAR